MVVGLTWCKGHFVGCGDSTKIKSKLIPELNKNECHKFQNKIKTQNQEKWLPQMWYVAVSRVHNVLALKEFCLIQIEKYKQNSSSGLYTLTRNVNMLFYVYRLNYLLKNYNMICT